MMKTGPDGEPTELTRTRAPAPGVTVVAGPLASGESGATVTNLAAGASSAVPVVSVMHGTALLLTGMVTGHESGYTSPDPLVYAGAAARSALGTDTTTDISGSSAR